MAKIAWRFTIPRVSRRAWSSLLVLPVAGAIALTGCRADAPPPPATIESAAPEPAPPRDAAAPVEAPGRDLWFAQGPGRSAIVARERRDHDEAVRLLDELLADASASDGDRAAAEYLRALEDLAAERYQAAAERLARVRAAKALAPIEPRIRLEEAQAWLDASDPARALELVKGLPIDGPRGDDVLILRADARARTDDLEGAVADYDAFLARSKGRRKHEVRAKLAKVVEPSDPARARSLYEALLLEVPLSDFGKEAAERIDDVRKAAGRKAMGKNSPRFGVSYALALVEAHLAHRAYAKTVKQADRFLRRKGLSADQRCRALYAKGSAIFKQRERAKARPSFDRCAKACGKAGAGGERLEVKCRYQGARGLYAEGKYATAAKAFQKLAKDHDTSSYVDDALVLAGEAYLEAKDPKRAEKAYLDAAGKGGDMADEARRRLLVSQFGRGDLKAATKTIEAGLASGGLAPVERARMHYFKGRILDAQGDSKGARAAWTEVLRIAPLEYPGLLAFSRLAEAGDGALQAATAELLPPRTEAAKVLVLPKGVAVERARILARLGLGEATREELKNAEVKGWGALGLLDDAGLYPEVQRMLTTVPRSFRAEPPAGPNERLWTIAHPRPFTELIDAREAEHGVPPLLTYAIMQTESRFDPGAISWAGARGLVQLMPSTAERVAKGAGIDISDKQRLHDPSTNLALGTRLLAELVDKYGGGTGAVALAIPSYNAGPGAVKRWLAEAQGQDLDLFIERIPYDETRKYTMRVLGRWLAYRVVYGSGPLEGRVPVLPRALP